MTARKKSKAEQIAYYEKKLTFARYSYTEKASDPVKCEPSRKVMEHCKAMLEKLRAMG